MSHSTGKAMSTTVCAIIVLIMLFSVVLNPVAFAADDQLTPFKKTETQLAYEKAIDIDLFDLDQNALGSYSYDGITIPSNLVENVMGTKLGQATMYTSIAQQLEGFYIFGKVIEATGTRALYPNWGTKIVPLVFGFEKLDYDEMLPYIADASLFINRNYPIGEMLSRFQRLSVCEGDFDYEKGICEFKIKDLSVAAKELGITEEMLGYIFAWLDVYGTNTAFAGNHCTCKLTYHADRSMKPSDFIYHSGYDLHFENEGNFFDEDTVSRWFAFDVTGEIVPNDSAENFSTDRGVQLLHSKDAVVFSYGPAESRTYDAGSNAIQNVVYAEDVILPILSAACTDYVVYTYEDNESWQLAFYFDKDEQVICVAYIYDLLYEPWVGPQYTDIDTVRLVQEGLNDSGYDCGAPDGIIGSRTTAALKKYQEDHNLIVNGRITDELLDNMGFGVADNEVAPTTGEKNALRTANSYLDSMPFSYNGLIKQLEYEGYSHSEAVYGVDNCGADWNEQTAKSAASYLDTMSFSRQGLIEQLEYEGFTHDQAVYGVEQNGY